MRTLHFCACALALAGCVEAEERSTDFEYLHAAIIEPMCATVGCHSRQTQQSPPNREAFDLSTPTRACFFLNDVPPGNLIDLLEGDFNDTTGDEYRQMPPDVPLPAADVELMVRWINEGASCD
jgi:hypothetical protein